MKINHTFILSVLLSIGLTGLFLVAFGCKTIRPGMLIATQAKISLRTRKSEFADPVRYPADARIIAFYPGRPGSVKILTEDFHSAAFPEISYAGTHILFTGQKNSGDPWQIWEMNLKNLKYRQIIESIEDCTDPAYLPGGRLVYSKLTVNDTVLAAHCLYTANLDGSDKRQITFSPCDNFSTLVMKDGRLLTVSRQLVPVKNDAKLMVMRPDGTKADMFYMKKGSSIVVSNPRETGDGKIVFIESYGDSDNGGSLAGISYNRPLHSHIDFSSGNTEMFLSVLPLTTDKYIISCRETDTAKFTLYEYDPVKKHPGEIVLSDPEFDILDVVQAKEHERPKKLPSEVDMQVKTGLLLCQDINFTGYTAETSSPDGRKAQMIEVLGIDTTYGIIPVEGDGSFQLKVLSDKPFMIRTLDGKGNSVSDPCSWLWLRPNERRGCVGCHEDPELAPVNRVSQAIKKPPVTIPVNVTAVKEKIVELE